MVTRRKLLRGNYNPTVKRRKYPNLQWAHVAGTHLADLAKGGKRVKLCTDCIKTLYKQAS